jgi:NAD(P)-dependent dehydrogenase (short-subunit alcohol dehydrogenase family)
MGLLEAHRALQGKTAAVIGGAFGVGRAVTMKLAQSGLDIALLDNDAESLPAITAAVEALGRQVLAIEGDATVEGVLENFYARVEQEFPRLDVCVNVAGGVMRSNFMDTSRAQNAADIRLNYGYILDSVRAAIPLIRRSGEGGSIVNFTTIEAYRGAATYAVYAGAKAATVNFSKALAVELGAEGIRVNLIAPDTSPARASNAALGPDQIARLTNLPPEAMDYAINLYVPQKRSPSQEDLANAVLFLASDLSRAITGTTIHVDGGTNASLGWIDWPYGDGFMPAPLAGTLEKILPK